MPPGIWPAAKPRLLGCLRNAYGDGVNKATRVKLTVARTAELSPSVMTTPEYETTTSESTINGLEGPSLLAVEQDKVRTPASCNTSRQPWMSNWFSWQPLIAEPPVRHLSSINADTGDLKFDGPGSAKTPAAVTLRSTDEDNSGGKLDIPGIGRSNGHDPSTVWGQPRLRRHLNGNLPAVFAVSTPDRWTMVLRRLCGART